MMIHGADEQKPPQVPQQYFASQPQPQPQPQPTTGAEEEEVRTLRIDNLHDWMDEDFIRDCVSSVIGGEVFNIKIIRNQKSGKSKCYGFIECPSHAIAERILQRFYEDDFPVVIGSKIRLNWASISGFGSGGEIEQPQSQEDDDDYDLAASDMVTTDCKLQQEEDAFTTHRQGHVDQTTRPVASSSRNVSGPLQFFIDLAEKKKSKTVDAAQRVSAIANYFGMSVLQWEKLGFSTKFEDLLDKLQGYDGSIDVANGKSMMMMHGQPDCNLQQVEDAFTNHRQGHATPTRGVPVRCLYLNGAPLYSDEVEEGKQNSDSNWEDMFEYWRNIDQTTRPVADVKFIHLIRNVSGPPQFFRDLAEKKESKTVDVAQRVSEIANFFERPFYQWEKIGITSTKFEDLLDELQGYAGSIDVANALHSIDSLLRFVGYLDNDHAGIRAKVAEVLTSMIQYDPRSQQLIMQEANCGRLLLYNLYVDPDATSRIKAFGAISALIWNNVPGITGFQLKDVYIRLKDGLLTEDDDFLRKALNLIHHLLHANNSDCNIVTELGFPHILMNLAFRDDAEVRQASLRCLLVLVRVEEGGNNGQLDKNDVKLNLFLRQLMAVINAIYSEDLGAKREERQLVDSLWNALREKGLLKLHEPSPIDCPVAELVEENSVAERKKFLMRKLFWESVSKRETLLLKRRKLLRRLC